MEKNIKILSLFLTKNIRQKANKTIKEELIIITIDCMWRKTLSRTLDSTFALNLLLNALKIKALF